MVGVDIVGCIADRAENNKLAILFYEVVFMICDSEKTGKTNQGTEGCDPLLCRAAARWLSFYNGRCLQVHAHMIGGGCSNDVSVDGIIIVVIIVATETSRNGLFGPIHPWRRVVAVDILSSCGTDGVVIGGAFVLWKFLVCDGARWTIGSGVIRLFENCFRPSGSRVV